ncbi:MAG TPA: hypothetical protein VME45_01150 [Stellaceae bacterium]|nr:hypothetical protein [Stellaceae bacterium]
MTTSKCSILTIEGAASLLETLHDRGYRVIGPTLREQAIVYDDVTWIADLPSGWTDEQDRGHYGLKRRQDKALFDYAVGPHSWKKFLHAPEQRLWRAGASWRGRVRRRTRSPRLVARPFNGRRRTLRSGRVGRC